MGNLTGTGVITATNLYESTTVVPSGRYIGELVFGSNGRGYRFGLAGELVVVGDVYQGPVIDTQFDNMAVTASAIATNSNLQQVNVTNGTTTVAANQFDGGSATVRVTPDIGGGGVYIIQGHTTGTSGAALVFTLDRPLGTAWSTSTKVTLRRSPWSGFIKAATTLTASVSGVGIYAIPSAAYGWLQTKGVASVFSDSSTFAAGSDVGVPGATAGYVGVNVAGTGKCNSVGRAMQANDSGVPIPVELFID